MCCDGCELPFKDNSFDLIIDKGTADALSCGPSWKERINTLNSELNRVMIKSSEGIGYISISYSPPHLREKVYSSSFHLKSSQTIRLFLIN